LVEGITLAPAVTGRVLLDATAYLIWGVASEFDDMTGIEHAGGMGRAWLSRPGRTARAMLGERHFP
jgi:hypothetical protein